MFFIQLSRRINRYFKTTLLPTYNSSLKYSV